MFTGKNEEKEIAESAALIFCELLIILDQSQNLFRYEGASMLKMTKCQVKVWKLCSGH